MSANLNSCLLFALVNIDLRIFQFRFLEFVRLQSRRAGGIERCRWDYTTSEDIDDRTFEDVDPVSEMG